MAKTVADQFVETLAAACVKRRAMASALTVGAARRPAAAARGVSVSRKQHRGADPKWPQST
jgi:hypothetical protein